jgi:hypothetical protein
VLKYCHVYVCDYRRGLDWGTGLLGTYTQNSELHVITAPPLSPQFTDHHSTSCSLATAFKCGDSSASCAHAIVGWPPSRN